MRAKIASVFLACMLAAGAVHAEIDLTGTAFDYTTSELTVTGATGNSYTEVVTVSVLPDGLDRAAATDSDINQNTVVYDLVRSGQDGRFTYSITMNGGFAPGKYAVYADTASDMGKTTFVFVDIEKAEGAVEQVNAAGSPAAVKKILSESCADLGIDGDTFAMYDLYIANVIFASKPAGGYDFDGLTRQYYIAYTMAELKNGRMTLEGIVSEYGTLIGIDAAAYRALSDRARAELEALVKAETGMAGDLYRYDYNFILAQLKTAGGYEENGEIILQNAAAIGIDLTKYNSIENTYYKDRVLQAVYGVNTSLEAVAAAWDAAVDTNYDAWKKSQQGGGTGGSTGSSGGSGIGSGGFTVTDGSGGNEDLFTPDGQPQFTEDQSEYFSDIVNHWAYASINSMYRRGIVNGYGDGTFRPDNTVTRAEFVKMLTAAAAFGDMNTDGVSFSDVRDTDWFAACVKAAAASGLVQGYDGSFRPLDSIMRQDAAVIIYNAVLGTGVRLTGSKGFDDDAEIAEYAREQVGALAANGIVNGSGGSFFPADTLTRAEAVTLIENFIRYTGR